MPEKSRCQRKVDAREKVDVREKEPNIDYRR